MHMHPRFSLPKAIYLLLFIGTVSLLSPSCSAIKRSRKESTYKKPRRHKTVAKSAEAKYRNDLLASAKKNLGIKYKYGGNTPKTGFDCSGFTKYVYAKKGVSLPRVSRDQAKIGKRVNLRYTQPGDLVFFGKGRKVSHVAMVIENKKGEIYVIHSTSSKGVKIDNITQSNYWKPRILYARNILGSVTARKP